MPSNPRPTTSALRRAALAAAAALVSITAFAPAVAAADTLPATSWATTADTYVSIWKPTTSHGSSKYLNADGPGERVTFLRFNVTGAAEGPQHTILRIRQSSAQVYEPSCDELWECLHYVRVSVRSVGPGGWDESTTFATAPPTGDVLGVAPNVKVRGYHSLVDIDLGNLVNGDGTYELAITSNTNTNYTFASRESGSPAQLLIAP